MIFDQRFEGSKAVSLWLCGGGVVETEAVRNCKKAEWLELRAKAVGGLRWKCAVSGQTRRPSGHGLSGKRMQYREQGSRMS